ncbi:hypothetical protein CB1_001026037, partial [Camelus ferus]
EEENQGAPGQQSKAQGAGGGGSLYHQGTAGCWEPTLSGESCWWMLLSPGVLGRQGSKGG